MRLWGLSEAPNTERRGEKSPNDLEKHSSCPRWAPAPCLTSSHLGQADNKASSLDGDVVSLTRIVATIARSQILKEDLARDVSNHQASLICDARAQFFYCAG